MNKRSNAPPPQAWLWTLLGSTVLALLSSCGGGTSFASGVDSGGTGSANTFTAGPINGLGSAIINGVRFDISTAAIVDEEGAALTPEQLMLGMHAKVDSFAVVTTAGEQTATATSVQIRSQLVGPVERVDLASNSLVLLGQSVRVTPATWFDAALAGGLSASLVGVTVEVYGQYDPQANQYVATRLASHLDRSAYKICGLLLAQDAANSTLNIGGLVVSYASMAPSAMPVLAIGDLVRVRLAVQPMGNGWKAMGLAMGHLAPPDRNRVSLSGRISAWKSSRNFSVEGTRVNAANALFADGEAGVVLGARVKLEGSSSKGDITAAKVAVMGNETVANTAFEVHGAIDAYDAAQQLISLHGVKVSITAQTAWVGGAAIDLVVGRKIKVLGALGADRFSVKAQTVTFE